MTCSPAQHVFKYLLRIHFSLVVFYSLFLKILTRLPWDRLSFHPCHPTGGLRLAEVTAPQGHTAGARGAGAPALSWEQPTTLPLPPNCGPQAISTSRGLNKHPQLCRAHTYGASVGPTCKAHAVGSLGKLFSPPDGLSRECQSQLEAPFPQKPSLQGSGSPLQVPSPQHCLADLGVSSPRPIPTEPCHWPGGCVQAGTSHRNFQQVEREVVELHKATCLPSHTALRDLCWLGHCHPGMSLSEAPGFCNLHIAVPCLPAGVPFLPAKLPEASPVPSEGFLKPGLGHVNPWLLPAGAGTQEPQASCVCVPETRAIPGRGSCFSAATWGLFFWLLRSCFSFGFQMVQSMVGTLSSASQKQTSPRGRGTRLIPRASSSGELPDRVVVLQ